MKANASLIDPLFKPISPDNTNQLALSKPTFIQKTLSFQALGAHYCYSLGSPPTGGRG
jgi:hypothetical protein